MRLSDIPALVAAVANSGRILIVNNATQSDVKSSLNVPFLARAIPDDLINGTITEGAVSFTITDVFENPKVLDTDCVIILNDAQDALAAGQGDDTFNHFMSITQRGGYKAAVIAPINLSKYDSHAAQYCLNVSIA